MSALNKVGTALTVVFVVSLVALVAKILYAIRRRGLLIRRSSSLPTATTGGVDCISGETSFQTPPPSKHELLYFCWNSAQASKRVVPDSEAESDEVVEVRTDPPLASSDADDEVLKWHQMYGPSRILFTVKEEEKEEMEAAHENNINIVLEGVNVGSVLDVEVGDGLEGVTPFSTPCASSPYYTPSPSPSRNGDASYYAEYLLVLHSGK